MRARRSVTALILARGISTFDAESLAAIAHHEEARHGPFTRPPETASIQVEQRDYFLLCRENFRFFADDECAQPLLMRFAVPAWALLSGGADDAEPDANISAIRSLGVVRLGIHGCCPDADTSVRFRADGFRPDDSGPVPGATDHAGRGAGLCAQPPTRRARVPCADQDGKGERRGAAFAVLPAPRPHRSVPGGDREQHDGLLPRQSVRRSSANRRYTFKDQQRRELEAV